MNEVMRFLILFLTALLSVLVGCSDSNQDPYAGWKADTIYQEGHRLLVKEDYSSAIKALESLQAQYPFESYTEQGDLELIYAYYRNDKPEFATTTAERYIRIYPNSRHLDYAYYMLGVVYYANGRTLFQRYMPYTLSKHDPSDLLQSYAVLRALIEKYPDTPYKTDALRRMVFLRNTIAAHELEVAEFSLEQKSYVAVVHHAQMVILHYPHTPQQEHAFELLYAAYDALHCPELADNVQKIMALNFPNNPLAHALPDPVKSEAAAPAGPVLKAS
jgi:outer membrane protein assembly factor BamD